MPDFASVIGVVQKVVQKWYDETEQEVERARKARSRESEAKMVAFYNIEMLRWKARSEAYAMVLRLLKELSL